MKPTQPPSNVTERHQIFTNQIATLSDLRDLKHELLFEIKKLLKEHNGQVTKKWLKTSEVQKLLGTSPGTLQRLRNSGTLPFRKFGGIVYYDYDELTRLLQPGSNISRKNQRR